VFSCAHAAVADAIPMDKWAVVKECTTASQFAVVDQHFQTLRPNWGTLEEWTRRSWNDRYNDTTTATDDVGVRGVQAPPAGNQTQNESSTANVHPATEPPPPKRARKANSKFTL
jgi:hypothetical protein